MSRPDESRKSKRGGWQRPALIAACIFLTLILIVLLVVGIYGGHLLSLIRRNDPSNPGETLSSAQIESMKNETDPFDPSNPPSNSTEPSWPGDANFNIGEDDNIINILLVGQDRRPGQGRQRSDSMILCTFNKEAKTLTMTSFMRDLYVEIPDHGGNRLNAAYAFGGFELLDATLKKNFGVHIDGNVEVDFDEFTTIIDMLGGVDIELTEAEVEFLNSEYNWTLEPGMTHMNGELALAYARIRKVGNDFGRTDRQRRVLSCLIENYKNQKVTRLLPVLEKILQTLTTDLSDADILGYVWNLFPLLSDASIQSQRIPGNGLYTDETIRGMMVLVPDLEANREILRQTLGGIE